MGCCRRLIMMLPFACSCLLLAASKDTFKRIKKGKHDKRLPSTPETPSGDYHVAAC